MRRLLALLWRVSRNDLRILWLALRSPARPRWLLPATVILAVYALSPFSYAIPVLGLVDDFVLVPLALHWLVRMLPPHQGPMPQR
jgi:uncharacterized membrane protein YkvA (DUF1232 family)